MRIGIIGIGNIGGTLARQLSAAGHDVTIANSKGADSVRPLAQEISAVAPGGRGAVEGADLIILSIPLPAAAGLASDLFDGVPQGVLIIDTGNYYPGMRDKHIAAIDGGQPESAWVAEQIERPVIKAFNNILARSLAECGKPKGTPGRLAIAVAGDDAAAKDMVMALVDALGFDPVDGGALGESWRQQPSTPGYCCDYDAATMRKGLGLAVKGEAATKRNELARYLSSLDTYPTPAEVLALNRIVNAVE